jgi:FMN phosphatase YigB (HAD superfamily)
MPDQDSRAIDFIFFDIGGTLGDRDAHTGKLVRFPSTIPMLEKIRDTLHVPIGIITTLGPLKKEEGLALLHDAGLDGFLDPHGFVCEHDNHDVAKPSPGIYRFAANQVGVPVGRCLFIGENLVEVAGAITAGMQGLLKPCPPGRDLG